MVSPGMTGSSGAGEVRLGAIGEAWSEVQKNLSTWIIAAVIYGVICFIFNVLQRAVGVKALPDGTIGGSAAMGFLVWLISIAVGAFVIGGFYRMALKQLNGESIAPGDIFSASDVMPALVIASLLSSIAIGIGALLCIIPGLILASLLMLATPLIVDKNASAVEALSQSFNTLKPHIGGSLVFLLAIAGINILGALLCGLGLLVSVPVSIVAVAIVYRDFFLGGTNISGDANLFPPIPNIPPRAQ